MLTIDEVLSAGPVLPVVTLQDAVHAAPLARALARGGVTAIELTLRTPAALEAIGRIAAEVPETLIGAGTVLTGADLDAALAAGARFAVSPGATPALLAAAKARGAPFLPAIATASELMAGLERGFTRFKFFPAAQSGGTAALQALAGPFPTIRFCPTGGINLERARDYLALANVACVGGSFLAPEEAIAAQDWAEIEGRARAARAALARSEG